MNHHNRRQSWPILALLTLGVLSACGKESAPVQNAMMPEVGVVVATAQDVAVTEVFSGRLMPIREAEVRARVAGVIERRIFKEGGQVKAGDVLYQIDDAPYAAALAQARASLATAEAAVTRADADWQRTKALKDSGAVSVREYDTARMTQMSAKAQRASAYAAIEAAKVNMNYAKVTAPISGRIGQALVTEGALVGQGQPTLLARIMQTDQLYIDVHQTAEEALALRQAMQAGQLKNQAANVVTVLLPNQQTYPHQGRLTSTDVAVDPVTGQVTLRAEIPNPDEALLPGMFVRIKVQLATREGAFLIPKQAVTRNEKGDILMIVTAEGALMPRSVTVAGSQDQNWIVTAGLEAGDKVVVDGMAAVGMMGAKTVRTRPWQPDNTAAAPEDKKHDA